MDGRKWDLTRLTTGERCALRGAAGSHAFDVAAWRAFYTACGACPKWEEPYWYAAMCFECLWRETDVAEVLPMAQCLRRFLAEDESTTKSLERRVDALLETPWGEDGFLIGKLLAFVRMLKAKTRVRPDFERLAEDLSHWNDEGRFVQRDWLRMMYAAKSERTADGKETEEIAEAKEEPDHDA